MSSLEFSQFPEFSALVSLKHGDVFQALDSLITKVSDDIGSSQGQGDQGQQLKEKVGLCLANIKIYYQDAQENRVLSPGQQTDLNKKIADLSDGVSILDGGYRHYLPTVVSSSLSWLWSRFVGPKAPELPPQGHSIGINKRKSQQQKLVIEEIDQQIRDNYDKLETTKTCFDSIVSFFSNELPGDIHSLQYQLDLAKKTLKELDNAYHEMEGLSRTLMALEDPVEPQERQFVTQQKEIISSQLQAFKLELGRFKSYLDSFKPSESSVTASSAGSIIEETWVTKIWRSWFGGSNHSKEVAQYYRVPFKNLAVTCYLNTFLKTLMPYFGLLEKILLHKRPEEEDAAFALREDLRGVLIALAKEVRKESPNMEWVEGYTLMLINNDLLMDYIPKFTTLFGGTGYHMSDAGGLATRVFDLMELNDNLDTSVYVRDRLVEILENHEEVHEARWAVGQSLSIIDITTSAPGNTIQQKLNNYFATQKLDETRTKTTFFIQRGGHFPKQLTFTISPQAVDGPPVLGSFKLEEFEEDVLIPFHNEDGILLGNMRMRLSTIGRNIPNTHFYAFVREKAEGVDHWSWTEHNDSIIIPDKTNEQIRNNVSQYGYQFSYEFYRFEPTDGRTFEATENAAPAAAPK